MADFPAIPFWTDAYLADTRHLSTLEHGAYLLLLFEAWRRPLCNLPDDDALLARLAGLSAEEWAAIRTNVMGFWKLDGRSRTWTQKKLTTERKYVADRSRKNRDAAAKRWNKDKKPHATAMQPQCQNDAPTPTPTPTPKVEDKETPQPTPSHAQEPGWDLLETTAHLARVAGVNLLSETKRQAAVDVVKSWRAEGIDLALIETAIVQARDSAAGDIHSLKYFDPAIRRHLAQREHPNGNPAKFDRPSGPLEARRRARERPGVVDRGGA